MNKERAALIFIITITILGISLLFYVFQPYYILSNKKSIDGSNVIGYVKVNDAIFQKTYVFIVDDGLKQSRQGLFAPVGLELNYKGFWESKIVDFSSLYTKFGLINDREQSEILSKLRNSNELLTEKYDLGKKSIAPVSYFPFNFATVAGNEYYIFRSENGSTSIIKNGEELSQLPGLPKKLSQYSIIGFSEKKYILINDKDSPENWILYDISIGLPTGNISLPFGFVFLHPENHTIALIIETTENYKEAASFTGKIKVVNIKSGSILQEDELPNESIDIRFDFETSTIIVYYLDNNLQEKILMNVGNNL